MSQERKRERDAPHEDEVVVLEPDEGESKTQGKFLRGCCIIICALNVGDVQMNVWKNNIERYGGKVVNRLDKETTHIITKVGAEETNKWLSKNVELVKERDSEGKLIKYAVSIHTDQWLIESLGRREKLSSLEFRVTKTGEPLPKSPAKQPTAQVVPPITDTGPVNMNFSSGWAGWGQPQQQQPQQKQGFVRRSSLSGSSDDDDDDDYSDNNKNNDVSPHHNRQHDEPISPRGVERPIPPCVCCEKAMRCVTTSRESSNYGRVYYCCGKGLGVMTGNCKFFEWADEPPREANFTMFKSKGYEYEKYMSLPYVPWIAKSPAKAKSPIPISAKNGAPEKMPLPVVEEVPELRYLREETIHPLCKCPVCSSPMWDPIVTPCFHNYCRYCITKWLEEGSGTCPKCRAPLTPADFKSVDRTLATLLEELGVACPNKGCTWSGSRGDWSSSHRRLCEYAVDSSSTDEGKEALSPKRHKTDPKKPPGFLKRIESPKKRDSKGLIIINDRDKVEVNGTLEKRFKQVDKGKEEMSTSSSSSPVSEEGIMAKNFMKSKVFSQYTPPSENEMDLVDEDMMDFRANGSNYVESFSLKLSPYMEKNKRKWAAANPNLLERRESENHNKELCDELKKIATSYEHQRDEWRARGYNLAAAGVARYHKKIESAEEALKIPGVGARIAGKIAEFIAYGQTRKTKLKDQDVVAQERLGQIHGVGATCVARLWANGVRSVEDLRERLDLLTPTQRIGLRYLEEFEQRIPREEVAEIETIVRETALRLDPNLILVTCGSYRRGKATCGDVDILITHRHGHQRPLYSLLQQLVEQLTKRGLVTDSLTSLDKEGEEEGKWMGVCQLRPTLPHRRIDFQMIARESWPFALLYFTGSEHFNRSMRNWARKNHMSLSQHALVLRPTPKSETGMHKKGAKIPCNTEEEVFKALKLDYVPPNERDI